VPVVLSLRAAWELPQKDQQELLAAAAALHPAVPVVVTDADIY